uniref:Conotoxin unclassified superfamily n=1 Tax=Conus monile TaxID=351660 RepID=A0A9Y2E2Q0_CONMO|nr:conotoxin precursor unclassified superfamily [Conus monile]
MGGRFVVTALIAVMLLSPVLAIHPDLNNWEPPEYITFPRQGRRSNAFRDWAARHAMSAGLKGTGGNRR